MLREAARSKFITIIRVDGLGLRRPSGSCLCGNTSDLKPHAAPPDWTLCAFFPFLSRQKTLLIIFCPVPRRFVLCCPCIDACFGCPFFLTSGAVSPHTRPEFARQIAASAAITAACHSQIPTEPVSIMGPSPCYSAVKFYVRRGSNRGHGCLYLHLRLWVEQN